MYNESKCDTHPPCIGVTWSLFSDQVLSLAPSGLFEDLLYTGYMEAKRVVATPAMGINLALPQCVVFEDRNQALHAIVQIVGLLQNCACTYWCACRLKVATFAYVHSIVYKELCPEL